MAEKLSRVDVVLVGFGWTGAIKRRLEHGDSRSADQCACDRRSRTAHDTAPIGLNRPGDIDFERDQEEQR
jgi:hypothetical protein